MTVEGEHFIPGFRVLVCLPTIMGVKPLRMYIVLFDQMKTPDLN